jgi:hypothetical protein
MEKITRTVHALAEHPSSCLTHALHLTGLSTEIFFLNGKTGLEGPGSCFIDNLDTLQTDPYREGVYNQVYKNSEKNQQKIAERDQVLRPLPGYRGLEICRPPRHRRGTSDLGDMASKKPASRRSGGGVPYTH